MPGDHKETEEESTELNELKVKFGVINVMLSNDRSKQLQRRKDYLKRMLLLKRRRFLLLTHLSIAYALREENKEHCYRFDIHNLITCDKTFKESFRMCRKSFDKLCLLLKDTFGKKNPYQIPLEKRVAVCLYYLGQPMDANITDLFSIKQTELEATLIDFCIAVFGSLSESYIKTFPLTKEKIKDCVEGFERKGFPQCLGAIGSCEITFQPNSLDKMDYEIYGGNYCTKLLALVDYRYRFLYISVGCPVQYSNSYFYDNIALKKELDQCPLLDELSKTIIDVEVPVTIVGNWTFQLSKNLITPYSSCSRNEVTKMVFNYELSKLYNVYENAFLLLKARFPKIGLILETNAQNVRAIVKAVCVLHNFLNEENDKVRTDWLNEFCAVDTKPGIKPEKEDLEHLDPNAEKIRNAIALLLSGGSINNTNCDPDDPIHFDNYLCD